MFIDSTVSLILTLSSIIKSSIVLDLIYISSSSLYSIISYLTRDSIFTRGLYNIDRFLSLLNFLRVNYNIDFKEFADITVVDL